MYILLYVITLVSPVLAYNSFSNQVWAVEYDIYGNIRSQHKGEKHFIPFRNQGQYEDEETGLYYNRFRYYDGSSGTYISQDPIGLAGGEMNLFRYVKDSNIWVDIFGLLGQLTELARQISEGNESTNFSCQGTENSCCWSRCKWWSICSLK